MIRRLIDAWRAHDEIAELRDRAITEARKAELTAEMNRGLFNDNTLLVARADQVDAVLRDARLVLAGAAHATDIRPCPICTVIDRIDQLVPPTKETTP